MYDLDVKKTAEKILTTSLFLGKKYRFDTVCNVLLELLRDEQTKFQQSSTFLQ